MKFLGWGLLRLRLRGFCGWLAQANGDARFLLFRAALLLLHNNPNTLAGCLVGTLVMMLRLCW